MRINKSELIKFAGIIPQSRTTISISINILNQDIFNTLMAKEHLNKIIEILNKNNLEFKHFTHDHVITAEEAARVRNTKIEEAAKALILKDKENNIYQFIISGHKRLELKKIKRYFGIKNIALADPDTVKEKTGCTVGSVPPFGTIFNLIVYIDKSVTENEYVVFSAGTHNDSIRMKSRDYINVVKGIVGDFGKE